MLKAKILRIVNPLLAVAILYQLFTVIMMNITGGAEWVGKSHVIAGYCLFFLVLFHLYLNWNWVKMTFFNLQK